MEGPRIVQPLGLEAVDGAVVEMAGEVGVAEDMAADRVHQE